MYCRACWVAHYGSQPPPPEPPQPCQFWRSTGRCKFGDVCRFLHGETLACATSVHPHTLGPGTSSGASRRKAYCDGCGAKCKGGWQCTAGCDYVLCSACLDVHRSPAEAPVSEGVNQRTDAAEAPAQSPAEAAVSEDGQALAAGAAVPPL